MNWIYSRKKFYIFCQFSKTNLEKLLLYFKTVNLFSSIKKMKRKNYIYFIIVFKNVSFLNCHFKKFNEKFKEVNLKIRRINKKSIHTLKRIEFYKLNICTLNINGLAYKIVELKEFIYSKEFDLIFLL